MASEQPQASETVRRHQAGDRRVAGQGADDRRLPRATATSSRPRSATSATCRATPPTCRPRTRASPGPASASTSTTTSSRSTSSAPTASSRSAKLKALLKDADELYLATDEDREGEAIAWHLVETLNPKVPVRRMVFHEITPQAIAAAVARPREIDAHLVDAQETRRILDRLYGYEVSPVLWKKVMPRLSAGRVQSVATRIVVERERARMRFRAAEYWDVEATFAPAEPQGRRPRRRSPPPWSPSTTSGSPPAATSTRRPAWRRRASCTSTRRARAAWPRGWPGAPFAVLRRRGEAVPAPAVPAVHDLDPAAGGRPQAPLVVRDRDAGRAAAVRERLHHLYAYRLDDAVRDRAERGPQRRPASCTATPTCRPSPASTPAR